MLKFGLFVIRLMYIVDAEFNNENKVLGSAIPRGRLFGVFVVWCFSRQKFKGNNPARQNQRKTRPPPTTSAPTLIPFVAHLDFLSL